MNRLLKYITTEPMMSLRAQRSNTTTSPSLRALFFKIGRSNLLITANTRRLLRPILKNRARNDVLFCVLCVFFIFRSPALLYAADESICKIATAALKQAEEIRGLKRKKSVPCKLHNKEQVKSYLLHVINTKVPKEKLDAEEFIYKVLGLIPESFSYKEGILDLYLSQLGGYYDPEKDHFVMAAWIPEYLQNTVAVHELTHALQDQYFNLDNYLDNEDRTSDQLLARSAVVEGDATAVMLDYTRRLVGQGPISSVNSVQSVMLQNVLGASLVGAQAGVPESLSLLIIFPYTSGLRFAHTLLMKKKGYSILDSALKDPPNTTEEILHPELHLSGDKSYVDITDSELNDAVIDNAWKSTYSDTLGEFIISMIIGTQSSDRPKAALAAAGWGGDRVAIFEKDGSKKLVWITKWDTDKDTTEFYEAMTSLLHKRFAGSKANSNGEKSWKSDRMAYRMLRQGSTVILHADPVS